MCGPGAEIKETPQERISAQKDVELWNYYQQYYKPLMDKYIAQTTDPTAQAEEKAQVAGQINAEVMKNVDPSKVSANPVENTRRLAGLATQGAGAQVGGQSAVKFRQLGALEDIINVGKGEEASAQKGLEVSAEQSVQRAIAKKQLQAQKMQGISSGIGSII